MRVSPPLFVQAWKHTPAPDSFELTYAMAIVSMQPYTDIVALLVSLGKCCLDGMTTDITMTQRATIGASGVVCVKSLLAAWWGRVARRACDVAEVKAAGPPTSPRSPDRSEPECLPIASP